MNQSKKARVRVLSKPVTMKTPDDFAGWQIPQRPKQYNLATMEACKTCARTEKTSRGFFCMLRCKTCGVPGNSKYDDCVNHKDRV